MVAAILGLPSRRPSHTGHAFDTMEETMKISAFSTDSRAGADHTRGQGVGPWIKQGRGLRGIQVAVLVALMATACVPHRAGEMSPAHGLGLGLGYLIASPLLILSGLLEGIVTAPYLLNADLHEMNRDMVEADTRVSFDEPINMPTNDDSPTYRRAAIPA